MNTLILPFPDSRLSPNRRKDRRWLTSVRDTARSNGYYAVKQAGLSVPDKTPLHMFLTFCPPDRRRRDVDNLLSASKSTIDGIFKALGVNDCNVRRTTLEMGNSIPGGQTIIRIEVIKP